MSQVMARREARVSPEDLVARVRTSGSEEWCDATVLDLSSSGARLHVAATFALGTHVDVALLSHGELRVVLTAGIVRVDEEASENGVHFTRMTPETRVRVEHEVELRRGALGSATVLTPRGPLSVSAEALQTSPVYDALDLRPDDSTEDVLRAMAEVRTAVKSALEYAEDDRRHRLIAVSAELDALTETLASARGRAAYDFSFNLVRADQRLQDAERNVGLPAQELREIWQTVFPARVTRAAEILAQVERGDASDVAAAVMEASALDPFHSELRTRAQTHAAASSTGTAPPRATPVPTRPERPSGTSPAPDNAAPISATAAATAPAEKMPAEKAPADKTPAPTPSRPIFDRYAVIRRLALGGMGEVLLAREVREPSRVLILKSLLPELAQNAEIVEQFLHEANIAARLEHPNIVRMQHVGRWLGRYYIAMEHIEGIDAGRLIRAATDAKERIPPTVAARIACDAALGLDAAHTACDDEGRSLGLVHRDVSPQNLMVRIDGVTKLVDFGISRSTDRASQTAAGVIKGKLPYMAPEQVRADAPDARIDQWGLGVVLWEMLTAQRLFPQSNELELLKAVLNPRIERPSSLVEGVPSALEEIVMRALSRERADRFPSCKELAASLAVFLHESEQARHDDVGRFLTRVAADDLDAVRRLREGEDPDGEQGDFFIDLSRSGARSPRQRGVHGSLADMTLLEIIQSLEQSRRGAEVEVWLLEKLIGIVGLEEGVVRYAACGPATKEEGFHALMQIPEGTFVIRYGPPRPELCDMRGGVSFLMLESLRRLDEGEARASAIEPVDDRYRLPGSSQPDDGAVASLQARAEAADRARLQEAEARVIAEQKAQAEAARREKLLENVRSTAEVMRKQLLAAEQARMDAETRAGQATAENQRLASEMKTLPRRVSPLLAGALGVSLALGALSLVQVQSADEVAAAKRFRDAVELTKAGGLEEGISILEALRRERPEAIAVLRQLGDAYARSGDRERALKAFQAYVDSPLAPADDVAKVRQLIAAASRR